MALATGRQILVRMLVTLKKLFVMLHSFPLARASSDALLAMKHSSLVDLLDRGLLAYHINDFAHALRDRAVRLLLARTIAGIPHPLPLVEAMMRAQGVKEYVRMVS